MDATMSGQVISGDDLNTRGNIARTVLRGILDTYKDSFNWGLGSFATLGSTLYNTHAYYVGGATTMVYTNICASGLDATHLDSKGKSLRCIANPDAAANGFAYLTYERAGDDADVNDVLYSGSTMSTMYGVGDTGTKYFVRGAPRDSGTGWTTTNFPAAGPFGGGSIPFTPTDAGFLPTAASAPRQIWVKRGWGYGDSIGGKGIVNESVMPNSTTHQNKLNTLLANETNSLTGEIKNNAFFTPLTGTLLTANDYFSKGLSSSQKSPITQTCQKNFVMLATDGNPTGKTDGTQYNVGDWADLTKPAYLDVFAQITALRNIVLSGSNLSDATLSGKKYDVQTYIVGMGDTVANANSVAALNHMADIGGGNPTAFLGSSSAALITAFQAIVGDILTKTSAASSVALNSGTFNTNAFVYQAKFDSAEWSGNVVSYAVAASGVLASSTTWEAATRMKAQDWSTGRKVLTYNAAASSPRGIAFRWPVNASAPTPSELDATQIAALNKDASGTTDGFGMQRLQYLRGDTTSEIRNCGTCTPKFRNRSTTPLGDIISSSPYYVGTPAFNYLDDLEAAPYSAFVATYRNRTPIIYAGANDGMLHGINANTGDEVLAYVPSMLVSALPKLTASTYTHRYYVDGSPTVGDVFYNGAWHSLLVSGLRAGAKGIFALDVTNPSSLTEANAANVVRWEFTHPDLGYVFSQPLLVKVNTGRWAVIVSGGYNTGSANGHAKLFVIDAETGALMTTAPIDTGAGTFTSPDGLSGGAAIDTNRDGMVDLVYAGDLNGNLWKFDLTSTSSASWGVGNGGLPLFTTPANQPITDMPDVTKFPPGGYLVTFGTGRYIDTVDIALPSGPPDPNPNNSTQAVYGISDKPGVNATVTLSQLQQQTIVAVATGPDGNDYRLSTHAVDPGLDNVISGDNAISLVNYYANKRGWYVNLPTTGERVVSDPTVRGGRVVLTSVIPDSSSACAFGGTGWILEFDAITGNRFDAAIFDTNANNVLDSSDYLTFAGQGTHSSNPSGRKIGAIPAAPGFMGRGDNKGIEDKYLNQSNGTIEDVANRTKLIQARIMWREVK
jgi:type IV pilus assembly protein PilY1